MKLTKDDKYLTREEKIILNGKHQIRNLPEQEDDICEYVEELFLNRFHKVADELILVEKHITDYVQRTSSEQLNLKQDLVKGHLLLKALIETLRAKEEKC